MKVQGKSGMWGEITFENAEEKSFWGGVENFRCSQGGTDPG